MSAEVVERIRAVGVMPILLPRSVDFVVEVTRALVEGGAQGVEVVLRNDVALEAMLQVRREFPDLLVAAGTVLTSELYRGAAAAGADFCISPGLDSEIIALALDGPLPLVPGVQTASEVMLARKLGIRLQKFYPSEPAGGTTVLADFGRIFPDVAFMPSGKIEEPMLPDYARLSNIASVGGTWMYLEGGRNLPPQEVTRRMRESLDIFHAERRIAEGKIR